MFQRMWKVMGSLALTLVASVASSQTDTQARAYLHETEDDIWFICRDSDGYLVWYEDGDHTRLGVRDTNGTKS